MRLVPSRRANSASPGDGALRLDFKRRKSFQDRSRGSPLETDPCLLPGVSEGFASVTITSFGPLAPCRHAVGQVVRGSRHRDYSTCDAVGASLLMSLIVLIDIWYSTIPATSWRTKTYARGEKIYLGVMGLGRRRCQVVPFAEGNSGPAPTYSIAGGTAFDFPRRVPKSYIMLNFATFRRGLCHAGNLIAGNLPRAQCVSLRLGLGDHRSNLAKA